MKRTFARPLRIAGVMTGTSCDALDVSILEFSPGASIKNPSWRVLYNASEGFDSSLRKEILALQEPGTRVTLLELLTLERKLGNWIGLTLKSLLSRRRQSRPDLIAMHGQTVAHHPAPPSGAHEGFTMQIGSPEAVAMATGLTVISHFRDGDILVGGHGAPLVPAFHREWIRKHLPAGAANRGIALHNIGGMSNLTYLGPRKKLIAFDTGPGNAWIDDATRIHTSRRLEFDRDGKIAAAHMPRRQAVQKLLRLNYFKLSPPKSTGRDDFPFELFLKCFGNDSFKRTGELVSTATELTAKSIIAAYERFVLDQRLPLAQVILCGGGALNRELVARVRAGLKLHQVEVRSIEEIPTPREESSATFLEAQAFAFFGYEALYGIPIGGEWTGSHAFAPPGRITPGRNFSEILARITAST